MIDETLTAYFSPITFCNQRSENWAAYVSQFIKWFFYFANLCKYYLWFFCGCNCQYFHCDTLKCNCCELYETLVFLTHFHHIYFNEHLKLINVSKNLFSFFCCRWYGVVDRRYLKWIVIKRKQHERRETEHHMLIFYKSPSICGYLVCLFDKTDQNQTINKPTEKRNKIFFLPISRCFKIHTIFVQRNS